MDLYFFNSSNSYGRVFLADSLLIHVLIWIVSHTIP